MEGYPFDMNDFVSWLKSFEPEAVVGKSRSGRECPIKNYLHTLNSNVISVYSLVKIRGGNNSYTLRPLMNEGAHQIMREIDQTFFRNEDDMITAQEVLAIVDKVYLPG